MPETPQTLPLLPGFQADRPLFLTDSAAVVTQREFLTQADALARTLPTAPYLINLCNDRYLFALAFAAGLIRGAVSLFPPNRLAATAHEIALDYPGAICIADTPVAGLELPLAIVEVPDSLACVEREMPFIAADREVFIGFTSGSTGLPRPHPKRWGDLVGCARAAARRFGFGPESSIVATVVPQHMYGMELSIMVPFATGACVAAARPFFPADIRDALARAPAPRILVTTPVHLAACVEAGLTWPAVDMVISATAPLSQTLAERVESLLSTQVLEIYGSTETGSIASRRTCGDPAWTWYDSVRPLREANGVSVTADFLPAPTMLADLLEFNGEGDADGGFRLVGRAAEMLKVGGKRASLADLNLKLTAIEGVRDGIFVAPDGDRDPVGRLAVIAVAPGLTRQALIAGLAGRIDPVFHPRRVVFVDRLPRNEAGKLPREDLLRILETSTETAIEPALGNRRKGKRHAD
ncbi:AMP-binding protein [Thiocapsa rosea]|uniref:Acyl-coenzyme A synthetase/AMP-(Fatty) acid ligase n=1 Tax=Thiocapsa rosea TaxID=69360 RepID=A0A495V1Y0_9GAMM|nr:AMP-binding protein [Thiocapsa rosea]RKT43442.1 acyl-coenzyme A synthetase/AMP-(fatty) acid ligase [Thiocapsa rosea]